MTRVRDLLRAGERVDIPPALEEVISGNDPSVEAYLRLDESVLLYAFHLWSESRDAILKDLSSRFLDRRLFAPIVRDKPSPGEWAALRTTAKAVGFHPDYYVSERVCNIPGYDILGHGITLIGADGEETDLSQISKLIRTLVPSQEHRLFLPKELIGDGPDPLSHRVRSILYSKS